MIGQGQTEFTCDDLRSQSLGLTSSSEVASHRTSQLVESLELIAPNQPAQAGRFDRLAQQIAAQMRLDPDLLGQEWAREGIEPAERTAGRQTARSRCLMRI